jgi:hypothetical protein
MTSQPVLARAGEVVAQRSDLRLELQEQAMGRESFFALVGISELDIEDEKSQFADC